MLTVVVVALAAHAAGLLDEDRVNFRVVRDAAAAACPADDELAERVRDRIGSEPFTDGRDDRKRELRLGIGKDGAGLVARVVLFAPNGTRLGVRVLHGDVACASLADDIVLAAAIAIDPLLLVRKRPPPPAPPSARPAPALAPPVAAPVTTTARAPTAANAAVARAADPGFSIPAPVSVSGRALLLVASGVGIIATPSVRVQSSFDYGVLDLDAGVRFDLPSRYPAGDTGALLDVSLVALDGAACFDWDYDAFFGTRGCGGTEVGLLGVQGIGFRGDTSPETAPWWALTARGMLLFRPFPELFAFVLAADGTAPLVRARFVDDTSGEVYAEPSLFGWDVGLGVEIQIR